MYERFVSHKAKPGKPFHMCGKDSQSCIVPYWIARAVYEFRWFLCGLLVTLVVTDIGKLVVGRLRPNFLDVCNPDFSQFNCTDQFGNPRYVTDYDCRGKPHDIDGSRYMYISLQYRYLTSCSVIRCFGYATECSIGKQSFRFYDYL